jgi:hypothetical protein
VREFRSLGSVRGAVSNDRPYREQQVTMVFILGQALDALCEVPQSK